MFRRLIAPCLVLPMFACASHAPRARSTEIAVVPVQHAVAAELVLELRALLEDRPTLRIVPDDRTNSVLLSGTPQEIAEAQELLRQLDHPAQGG